MKRGPSSTLHLRLSTVVLAAALIAVTWQCRPAFGQRGGNSISGRVVDSSRKPVGNMWVELLDEVNSIIGRVRTDSSGRFEFPRLSAGVFQVRVVTAGTEWAPQTTRVELAQAMTAAGGSAFSEYVNFVLKPGSAPAVAGTFFAQEVPEAARKAFDDGVAKLAEGTDVEGGLASLNMAIEAFPTYFMALERLGIAYVKLSRYEPAIPLLTKALEVNPNAFESLYTLGVAQYRLKKYAESTATLRKSLTMAATSPNAPLAQYFLGLALLRDGKPGDAEPQLRKAYKLGGRNIPSDVHMALAQIYSNDRRYREAISELELFLKESPDAPDAEKIRTIIAQLRQKAG